MSYAFENERTYQVDDDSGERTLLANFRAVITHETRYVDGRTTDTYLTLQGFALDKDSNPIDFQSVEIAAEAFAGMSWVMPRWGVAAVIQPGGSIKDALRTAIQTTSAPTVTTIYKHLGWTTINGKPYYLHAGGGIGKKGNDPTLKVQLPVELSRYDLANATPTKEAVTETLKLATIAPPEISWPILAATLAPLFGEVDYAIHLTGRTGSFKSELLSLYQCHYGAGMDARHLPGSWSSTPNALECQAYYAKNAAFVVDDFVPSGTAYQQRAYQQTAEKIIRSQGNQAGRARLTDASSLQTTMYPRGVILSTGEDTPEGHSIRARMMILEISPGDIKPAALTAAQAVREKYSGTVAGLCHSLANAPLDLTNMAKLFRDKHIDIGHSRTPAMVGHMMAVINSFLLWCKDLGVIDMKKQKALTHQADEAILAAGNKQKQYLESSDPCELFASTCRHAFGAGLAHIRTLNGGVPLSPTLLGWTDEGGNDIPTYRSHGPCIGWVDWSTQELFLDVNLSYNVVKKVAGSEMTLTKQTLFKRLKEAGLLCRTDEARQRNSVRVTAENHPRHVLCFEVATILDIQELPGDGDAKED